VIAADLLSGAGNGNCWDRDPVHQIILHRVFKAGEYNDFAIRKPLTDGDPHTTTACDFENRLHALLCNRSTQSHLNVGGLEMLTLHLQSQKA
jgi:hypothetical protein